MRIIGEILLRLPFFLCSQDDSDGDIRDGTFSPDPPCMINDIIIRLGLSLVGVYLKASLSKGHVGRSFPTNQRRRGSNPHSRRVSVIQLDYLLHLSGPARSHSQWYATRPTVKAFGKSHG